MGLIDEVREAARQAATQDNKFLRQFLYFFELRIPPTVGPPGQYLYPLILPPTALRMQENFAVDMSYTNGAGVFVEEQGILVRELTISGTTGWAPRKQKSPISAFSSLAYSKSKTFSRATTESPANLEALSGQRHFQFLQDTVFRTYGDLKQDPATAAGTELYFHNIKDDEHWRVIPKSFTLTRDSGNPLSYLYEIEMTAIFAADSVAFKSSEDQGVLKSLQDVKTSIRAGIAQVRAGLLDLVNVQGQLRAEYGSFVGFLDGVNSLVESAEALVNGSATLIQQPFQLATNTINTGLDALVQLITGEEQTTAVGPPANLLNSIRKTIDGVQLIASYPGAFQNSTQAALAKFEERIGLASRNREELLAARASSPGSTREFALMGSSPMPGDSTRANAALGFGRQTPQYRSAWEYKLAQGDSLPHLAARFLEDARNWKYICIFNNLQPPFISEDGLPGTVKIGDTILIPSTAAPPTAQVSQVTLGVRQTEATSVHLLGRDLLMDYVTDRQLDLVVDTDNGGTDFKTVEGVPNLKQAIRTRLITERGSDPLYHSLGTSRLVGLGVTAVDLETAKFRMVESVQADPRISAVRSISFDNDQADAVLADVVAEVRGFAKPERIQISAR